MGKWGLLGGWGVFSHESNSRINSHVDLLEFSTTPRVSIPQHNTYLIFVRHFSKYIVYEIVTLNETSFLSF